MQLSPWGGAPPRKMQLSPLTQLPLAQNLPLVQGISPLFKVGETTLPLVDNVHIKLTFSQKYEVQMP